MDNGILESTENKELPTDTPEAVEMTENAEEPTEVTEEGEAAEAIEKNEAAENADVAEKNGTAENTESAREIARCKAAAQAGYVMSVAALVLTLIFYLGEYLFRHTANYALCATVLGTLAMGRAVMYSSLKERRDLVLTILYAVVAVTATVLLFVDRVG